MSKTPLTGPPPTASVPSGRQPVGDIAVRAYGKYYLIRKLAEGGMAEIFLAKQVGVEGFERDVVIKRMLNHLSEVPDFVTMFLDEARLASRLSHPNIVQINDLGLADGCYFISMEYLAGEDFSTVLRTAARRRTFVPIPIVLRVIIEAARGLDFAHNSTDAKGQPLNIVHRDVSPSNIFVTYSGQVRMLDFGIAKAESRLTNTTSGVVKGKYQYMSPEQARTTTVDRRSDVYSLGVSLYESLTNTRPFARDSDLAILNAVLTNEYRKPTEVRPDLPLELESIIVKALAPIPENRYQSAADFAADLEKYLGAQLSHGTSKTLAQFMVTFFGQERVVQKTQIESLKELSDRGVDVPGYSNPHSPKTEPDGTPPAAWSTADKTRPGVKHALVGEDVELDFSKPKETTGKKGLVYGVIAGVVLLAIGIGAGRFFAGTRGETTVVTENTSVDAAVAKVESVDAAVSVVDAPDAAVMHIEEPADAAVAQVKVPVITAAPIVLTEKVVQRVVSEYRRQLEACCQKYKDDLPSAQGQMRITFTIATSGKVTNATSEFDNKEVGKCLGKIVKGMRFPRHKPNDVTLTLPVSYTVAK